MTRRRGSVRGAGGLITPPAPARNRRASLERSSSTSGLIPARTTSPRSLVCRGREEAATAGTARAAGGVVVDADGAASSASAPVLPSLATSVLVGGRPVRASASSSSSSWWWWCSAWSSLSAGDDGDSLEHSET